MTAESLNTPVEIEAAMRGWLLSDAQWVADDKRRKAIMQVRKLVGNAVFAGRKPQGSHAYGPQGPTPVHLAMSINRTNVSREYVLDGESDYAQSMLTVTHYARGQQAGAWAKRLAEWVRIATTNFRGDWSYLDDHGQFIVVDIDAATIAGERELPPIASTADGERWHYRYSVDWRVTHMQSVPDPSTTKHKRKNSPV